MRVRYVSKSARLDGALSNEVGVTGAMETSNGLLFFGCDSLGRFFNGFLDEVRISDIARDASWIKTRYNNVNDPSAFIEVGVEQVI